MSTTHTPPEHDQPLRAAPYPLIERWVAWLAHEAPRPLAPATQVDYQRHIIAFARWLETTVGVPLAPAHITLYRVEQYAAILADQVTRGTRKAATYNKLVAALSSFGGWLAELGGDNPARRLRTITERLGPPQVLDLAVIAQLVDAAHHSDLRTALIIELLVHTGMRASEVAGIQLDDLEHSSRTTWVRIRGRSAHQRRVPLPQRVSAVLQRYLDLRTAAEGQRPSSGPLLVGERGGLTRTTINRIVTAVAARTRLTEEERALVTPQALRHSVAAQLVHTGDLATAAELLGHASLSTTRRYRQPRAQDLEAAIEALYEPHELPAPLPSGPVLPYEGNS